MPRCIPTWIPFLQSRPRGVPHRTVRWGTLWGPPALQPEHEFWKIALPSKQRFLIPFGCQLGSIWAPKIHKNPSKNKSQEASQKWSIFGSIFCPSWLHVGTQVGTQEPLQTVPKRLQDAPKTPRRQPKSHKSTQDRNLVHFWSQSPMGYPPPLASIFEVCDLF